MLMLLYFFIVLFFFNLLRISVKPYNVRKKKNGTFLNFAHFRFKCCNKFVRYLYYLFKKNKCIDYAI